MKLPEIIGISGTNGAGKDTLAELRFERQNARLVSLSDILRAEATNRGLDQGRESLGMISTEWGRVFGAGALSLMTIRNYWDTRTDDETGLSIVSVRRPAEAEVIQEDGGTILWIDADRELRYQRVLARLEKSGRITDAVSYEEFCAQEDREMHPESDDPFALNMAGVRDIANIHLENNFVVEGDEDGKLGEAKYKAFLVDEFEL